MGRQVAKQTDSKVETICSTYIIIINYYYLSYNHKYAVT